MIIIPMVNGALCEEDMGICDDNCNTKCESSKQDSNGKGKCEILSSNNNVGSCKCLYECGGNSSSKQKRCNVGIGPCSVACNDVCCDQNCAAQFPGPQDGHGLCLAVGPISYNNCLCSFNC
ncbi:hypothetical protein CRYUN_Cryun11dG0051000 [Craigia yunnanensis]